MWVSCRAFPAPIPRGQPWTSSGRTLRKCWSCVLAKNRGGYFSNDRPIIAAYTPKEKMGIGQGVSFTGLGIGMAVGVSLAGIITQTLGWRCVFYLYSLPALAAALVLLKVVKEPPRPSDPSPQERVPYRLVFQHEDIWLYSLGGIAAIYVLWVLVTWAPAMFQEIGVKELALASTYSSLLGIAAVPGLLLAGWFSDWTVRRGKGRKTNKGYYPLVCLGRLYSRHRLGSRRCLLFGHQAVFSPGTRAPDRAGWITYR